MSDVSAAPYTVHASYNRLGEITVTVSKDGYSGSLQYLLSRTYLMSCSYPVQHDGGTVTCYLQGSYQASPGAALDCNAAWFEMIAGDVFEGAFLRAAFIDAMAHLESMRRHDTRVLIAHVAPDLFQDREARLAYR